MNEQIRIRIDSRLADEAAAVCKRLGGLPFHPSEFPALDEYGATLKQAEAAIAQVAAAFDDPHTHRGLGLRKLARPPTKSASICNAAWSSSTTEKRLPLTT